MHEQPLQSNPSPEIDYKGPKWVPADEVEMDWQEPRNAQETVRPGTKHNPEPVPASSDLGSSHKEGAESRPDVLDNPPSDAVGLEIAQKLGLELRSTEGGTLTWEKNEDDEEESVRKAA